MQLSLPAPSGFDRADIGGFAVVLGLGAALAWLCAAHPAALPPWAPWEFSWSEFLATACALWWFARGLARSAPGRRMPVWRRVLFLLGVGAIYAVVQTRFTYLEQHMFFLNRVQHIVMHHLGPFLIALSWPGPTLMRGMPAPFARALRGRTVRRVLRVVQQPALATVLFLGLIFLWLIPAVHFRAMLDPVLYDVMNWSMVADGLLFWVLVMDPRPCPPAPLSYPTRTAMAFLLIIPQIFLGTFISTWPHDLYPYYALCGRIFPGISAMADQEIGGLILWVPAGMMSSLATAMVIWRACAQEQAQAEAVEASRA